MAGHLPFVEQAPMWDRLQTATNGGTVNWLADCHGDTHSVFVQGDAVYNVGHVHECGGLAANAFQRTEPWGYSRALAFSRATKSRRFSSRCSPYSFHVTPSMPLARSLSSR
jgi:acetylornithine/succinyldiaminopimelate/putrescine aminotransferase